MCLLPKQNPHWLSRPHCTLGDSCLKVVEWEAGGYPAPFGRDQYFRNVLFLSFVSHSVFEEKGGWEKTGNVSDEWDVEVSVWARLEEWD